MTLKRSLLRKEQVVPGQKGSYRITSEPAGGAYADVYFVEDTSTHEKAILKLNVNQGQSEPQILARVSFALRDEGLGKQVVSVIDRVAALYDGKEGHIEEIAPGYPLKELLPNETEAVRIALEVARILRACARRGIAYLDIKPPEHVFWQREPWQVTLIDWNIARLEAPALDLRQDVLSFCAQLPSFFTACSQEDRTQRLHPLSWELQSMQDQQQRFLSYASWGLLAELSLHWGVPVHRSLAPITALPKPLATSDSGESTLRKQVLAAWDVIIDELEELDQQLTKHDSSLPDSLVPPQDKTEQAEILIRHMEVASVRVQPGAPEWKNLTDEAGEVAADIRKQIDMREPRRGQPWGFYEQQLRICRLLGPQDASAALGWLAHTIWERGTLKANNDATWQVILQELVKGNVLGVQQQLDVAGEALLQEIEVSTERSGLTLKKMWSDAFRALRTEVDDWALVYTAQQERDPKKALSILKNLTMPEHPLALPLQRLSIEKETQKQEVRRAKKQLFDALRNRDLPAARQALAELQARIGESRTATRLVARLEPRVRVLAEERGIAAQVKEALATWERTTIEETLILLATLPANEATAELTEQLRSRLTQIDDLKGSLQPLQSNLAQLAFGKSIDEVLKNAEVLGEMAEQLRRLNNKYPDAPLLKDMWDKWYTRKESMKQQSIEDISAKIDGLATTNAQLDLHSEMLESFSALLEKLIVLDTKAAALAPEAFGASLYSVDLSDLKDKVEQRLAEFTQRYRLLREEFDDSLARQGRGVEYWANLHGQAVQGPPLLQDQYVPKILERWRTSYLDEVRTLISKGDAKKASKIIEDVPPALANADFDRDLNKLTKAINTAELVEQGERCLAKAPNLAWISQARTLTKKLASLPEGLDPRPNDVRQRLSEQLDEIDRQEQVASSLTTIQVDLSELHRATVGTSPLSEPASSIREELAAVAQRLQELADVVGIEQNDTSVDHDLEPRDGTSLSARLASIKQVSEDREKAGDELYHQLLKYQRRTFRLGVGTALLLFLLLTAYVTRPVWSAFIPSTSTSSQGTSLNEEDNAGSEQDITEEEAQSETLETPSLSLVGEGTQESGDVSAGPPEAVSKETPEPTITRPSPTEELATQPSSNAADTEEQESAGNVTPRAGSVGWLSGQIIPILDSPLTVYEDEALTQSFWEYLFQGEDVQGNTIVPTVRVTTSTEQGPIPIETEFRVYNTHLTVIDTVPVEISAGARLRSLEQLANEEQFPSIAALLAETKIAYPITPDMIVSGPETDDFGTWYGLRLPGWIGEDQVSESE